MTYPGRRDFRKRTIVHLAEGSCTPRKAKTSRGVLMYSPHDSIGIIDSTNVGRTAQQLLGGGGDVPIRSCLNDFLRGDTPKPDTLVVGVTPVGGHLPSDFRRHILDSLEAGIDVWSGMHHFLSDDHEIRVAAERGGAEIWDVRKPPEDLPVGYGHMMNSKTYTVLMVGTDCALGKMTVALELQRGWERESGKHSEFIATGQTGMMIAGWGHPIDAIPGDFMAGCVEKDCLAVDGRCDIIFVEGQGSLLHPGYSPVTLALIHGCMPDAMILCHQPGRTSIANREHVLIPSLKRVGKLYEDVQEPIKPSKVIGVCLNTYGMDDESAQAAIAAAEENTGLPANDIVRNGPANLIEAIRQHREQIGK